MINAKEAKILTLRAAGDIPDPVMPRQALIERTIRNAAQRKKSGCKVEFKRITNKQKFVIRNALDDLEFDAHFWCDDLHISWD